MKIQKIVLILGGARSGKSRYALQLAEDNFVHRLFLATAEPIDDEMRERICFHKKSRGSRWHCAEEPVKIADIIRNPPVKCDVILLDCVTVWLGNILLKEGDNAVARRCREVLVALRKAKCPVLIVSNEVGMGIVPDTKLGRMFRDIAGRFNTELADIADVVVFVVAGLPVKLKGNIESFLEQNKQRR